jgi:WXG100 family type VII secretion target
VQQSVAALEQGGWEGRGSQAFFSEMQSKIFPAMRGLTHALEEGRAVTLETTRIFQQADEEAGRLFGVDGASSRARTLKELFDNIKDLFDMSEAAANVGVICRSIFSANTDGILNLKGFKWAPKSVGVALGLIGMGLTTLANWQDYEEDDNRFRKTVVSTIIDSILSIGLPIAVITLSGGGALALACGFIVGFGADWIARKFGIRDWAINNLDRGVEGVSNVAKQANRALHLMVRNLSGSVGL